MSWKWLSVKFHPEWHDAQRPLPLKRTKPFLAESEMAVSSPSIQASKGAKPETIVRS